MRSKASSALLKKSKSAPTVVRAHKPSKSQRSLSPTATTTDVSHSRNNNNNGHGHGSQRSLGGWVGGSSSLDTSLNLQRLEELLCERIPKQFPATRASAGQRFRGIAQQTRLKDHDRSDIICFLEDCLSAPESANFSFAVKVDIHASLGLVYELRKDSGAAINYFMTALWLLHRPFKSGSMMSSKDYDLNTQVATNLYRLGACYGRLGDVTRMNEAFDRAEWFREGDIFIAVVRA
jgi:hypothetical protein